VTAWATDATVQGVLPQTFSSDRRRQVGRDQESAAAEVERLTKLRYEAEKGSAEHRELNHRLMKARRRLYKTEWGGSRPKTLSTIGRLSAQTCTV
jgi:hypothetical protein